MSRRLRIAWGITGAGHYLQESVKIIERLVYEFKISTIVYISRAGREVLRMYGIHDEFLEKLKFSKFCDVVFEEEEGHSYPRTGKVYIDVNLVVVSPTTFNTLAKIANGICDTLVTNLVAHALKARVPVILVVPDLECPLESEIPIYINHDVCISCDSKCVIVNVCPKNAIYIGIDELPHVDLLKCDRCGVCASKCPLNAIEISKKITIYRHPLLASLVERVRGMGIAVFGNPEDMWKSMLMRTVLERSSIMDSSRTS